MHVHHQLLAKMHNSKSSRSGSKKQTLAITVRNKFPAILQTCKRTWMRETITPSHLRRRRRRPDESILSRANWRTWDRRRWRRRDRVEEEFPWTVLQRADGEVCIFCGYKTEQTIHMNFSSVYMIMIYEVYGSMDALQIYNEITRTWWCASLRGMWRRDEQDKQ